MTKAICKKINNQKPKAIAKHKFPNKPAVYMILEGKKKTKPLYMGQTKDLSRRLSEHLRRETQKIDKKLKKVHPDRIQVKYHVRKDARRKEQSYIKCMEKLTGRPLPYNKIKGVSGSRKKKQSTRRGKKTSKK